MILNNYLIYIKNNVNKAILKDILPYGFYMAFGFIGLRPFGVAYNCRDTWQGLSEIDSRAFTKEKLRK